MIGSSSIFFIFVPPTLFKFLGGGGVVASYPFLSQAPTPVEVEFGCDNFYSSPNFIEK